MKGSKRTLVLIVVLVLVLVAGYFLFFSKKKPKKAAPKPKPPLAELAPSPTPLATPPAKPAASPIAVPVGTPIATTTPVPGTPGLPIATPAPQATPPPSLPIPRAESLPTESQPVLEITTGAPINTAEGTTLALEQVTLNYAGTAKVKFFWELTGGPSDSIKIIDPRELKTRVLIEDLEQPTEFTLKLTAGDGKTEASADLKITGFPAKLTRTATLAGAWSGISHMGSNWVAYHGNTLEIFNPAFEKITDVTAPGDIQEFFAVQTPQNRGAIFVQSSDGAWSLLQSDQVTGTKVSPLPMVSKGIRKVIPFDIENAPYAFGLLERGVELWNLSDAGHPRLKTSIGAAFLKNPLHLSFLGRNLYVADEELIHLIDFQTGNLVASVPAGGSITSLQAYSWDGKNYLLIAIGNDRLNQNRKDFGLRLFEIGEDGRLSGEKRLAFEGNPPVRLAYVVPGSGKALVGVEGTKGLELRMAGLKPLEEIAVDGVAASRFIVMSGMETGKIGEEPVAVVADGNQLKVLSFKAAGERRFSVSQKMALATVLNADWVQAKPDGSLVWVGDEGTAQGGALAVLKGDDLKAIRAENAPPATFPAAIDVRSGSDEAPVLLLAEDIRNVTSGALKEGLLGIVNAKDPTNWNLDASNASFGAVTPQGILRPLGVAARAMEGNLRIGAAISRLSGNTGGAGVMIWDKPNTQAGKAFLQGDLAKSGSLIPLGDVRGIAFTKDGKAAYLAGGLDGVIAVDLEKKQPRARMSLGSKEWWADRVVLGNGGNILVATFLQPANQMAMVKIFGITPDLAMREYGTIPGLKAVTSAEGLRSPVPALTEDELYLFIPSPGRPRSLSVYNLSNPLQPFRILEMELGADIRSASVAKQFKNVFLALGLGGVSKLEFGF